MEPSRRPLRIRSLLLLVLSALVLGGPSYQWLGGEPPHAPAGGPAQGAPGSTLARHAPPMASIERRTAALPQPHAGTGVDPYAHFSSEPAPIGITDFGVYPNGTGYAYSTSTFLGTATFTNFSAYTASFGTREAGLQLNVILRFANGGTSYEYWIQDVVFVVTSTNTVRFLNNIWNMTSGSGFGVYPSSITGNGSCSCTSSSPGIYIAQATSQPGNGVNLTNPYTLQLRTFTTVVGGIPRVYFDYNDGYGWQTFDTARFSFATAVTSSVFRVDGTQYIMGALYRDAELILGGPGGGSSATLTGGGVQLSLEYDNGHNLQIVPNAFNFGSDTAETVSHARISSALVANGTQLVSEVTSGSGGSPAALYNSSSYTTITVHSPTLSSGTVRVNGAPVSFQGGEAVVSVAPGHYSVALYNGSTSLGETNLTLAASSPASVTLPFPKYAVVFHETGLPSGTVWGVHLGGVATMSNSAWLNLSVNNGSYNYSIDRVAGFVPTRHPTNPVGVAGAEVRVEIGFTTFNFTLRFETDNLPNVTVWTVTVGSTTVRGPGSVLSFSLPNGTYGYSVAVSNVYQASPGTGNVTVLGGNALVYVSFALRLAYVAGVVRPVNATLLLNGAPVALNAGAFNVSELPGNYTLEATAPGYTQTYSNVTLTPGNTTVVGLILPLLPEHPSQNGAVHPTPSSGPGVVVWLGVAVAAAAIVAGAAVVILRRGPSRR